MAVNPDPREATLCERVRDVYVAFRNYRLASSIEPDPCFPEACDDRPLRADPLHRLPPAAFEWYQLKAMTTWGSVDDFKHFLPRLLEIISTARVDDAMAPVDASVVFDKLTYAEWRRWPRAEREALDAYFDALWSALLARTLDTSRTAWRTPLLGDWLRDFAFAHEDLVGFLNQWEAEAGHPSNGLTAAAHLANTILDARDKLLNEGSFHWDLYDRLREQKRQFMAWLASDAVDRLLEAAFFRWSETSQAPLISEAHYWLGQWRQRPSAGA